jgi:hypothetical protein
MLNSSGHTRSSIDPSHADATRATPAVGAHAFRHFASRVAGRIVRFIAAMRLSMTDLVFAHDPTFVDMKVKLVIDYPARKLAMYGDCAK